MTTDEMKAAIRVAEDVIELATRHDHTPAEGTINMPGHEPMPWEPQRLIRHEGRVIEEQNATLEYVEADLRSHLKAKQEAGQALQEGTLACLAAVRAKVEGRPMPFPSPLPRDPAEGRPQHYCLDLLFEAEELTPKNDDGSWNEAELVQTLVLLLQAPAR